MQIGVPKEIKNHEYRVGLSPASAKELISHGHSITITTGAAAGIGLTDEDYQLVGCEIAKSNDDIFTHNGIRAKPPAMISVMINPTMFKRFLHRSLLHPRV